jgi:hypothetical protein
MALQIEFYIEGEREKGPIDLEASLASLREHLARAAGGENARVTLQLSSLFSADQTDSAPDWDPNGELSRVWQSDRWIVLAGDNTAAPPAAEDEATEEILERG